MYMIEAAQNAFLQANHLHVGQGRDLEAFDGNDFPRSNVVTFENCTRITLCNNGIFLDTVVCVDAVLGSFRSLVVENMERIT